MVRRVQEAPERGDTTGLQVLDLGVRPHGLLSPRALLYAAPHASPARLPATVASSSLLELCPRLVAPQTHHCGLRMGTTSCRARTSSLAGEGNKQRDLAWDGRSDGGLFEIARFTRCHACFFDLGFCCALFPVQVSTSLTPDPATVPHLLTATPAKRERRPRYHQNNS